MDNFRTLIQIKPAENKISYATKLFFIGSCFSENISQQLNNLKFTTLSNPYGIIFNPISIKKALQEIVEKKQYTNEDLVFHNELYHSMQHHGRFSTTTKKETLSLINSSTSESHIFLKEATHVFITLGTAWVYEYQNEIVANCHKIPNKEFIKKLLSLNEVTLTLNEIIRSIKVLNSTAKIVFTLSPVRHLKDGMQENSISKGILRAAIAAIEADYFPSFEIMMDDLRDYRFYEADMLHPNKQALDYIFEQFSHCYLNEETMKLMQRIQKYNTALNHRPLHADTTAAIKHYEYLESEDREIGDILKLKRQ